MLFPTFEFLVFFVVTVACLAAVQDRPRARTLVLLIASYVFYMQWNWTFAFLLAGSSVFTYLMGRLIVALPRRQAIVAVAAAVTGHLLVLCAYKYADLLIGTANRALHQAGAAAELPFLGLILPVGISFFTFHGISYVVDVYRGDVAVCRRIEDMLLYLAFFPQLVAGPIVRASFFLPQLTMARPARLPLGPPLLLILGGLIKKVIVASYLATEFVDPVFIDPTRFSALELLLAAYAYAVQIYCDFSGYTDMAVGIAALLGYYFPPNFNQPYRAASFQDFWRRWHISLSSWLRDYLYKPLGGSRHGPARLVFALMTTMLLGGLWHGADWKFVVWGGLHGTALVLERWIRPQTSRWTSRRTPRLTPGPLGTIAATLLVFHTVCLAWIFFRADTIGTAILYLQTLLGGGLTIEQARPLTLGLVAAGLLMQFLPPGWAIAAARRSIAVPDWALAMAGGLVIVLVEALGPDGIAPFIYFQF